LALRHNLPLWSLLGQLFQGWELIRVLLRNPHQMYQLCLAYWAGRWDDMCLLLEVWHSLSPFFRLSEQAAPQYLGHWVPELQLELRP
jgi:hypothetical protein